ncbi:MAG: hypothetical protein CMJ34_02695 [Phycisphaerae bacterium]|nr:hypothetical protein [Phycisphaerae bacterium]
MGESVQVCGIRRASAVDQSWTAWWHSSDAETSGSLLGGDRKPMKSRESRSAVLQPSSPSGAGPDAMDIGETGSDVAVAAAGLDRLRGYRVRRVEPRGIDGLVSSIRRDASRHRNGTGSFVEAWEAEIPESLRVDSAIRSIRGGVARVEVPDSAVKYELEQALRAGLLARLRMRFGQPLRRVRIDVAGSAD